MDELPPLPEPYFTHPFGRELWHDDQMRAYAAAAVAAERERCAKLCEEDSFEVGAALAAEIRRSQQDGAITAP